jgi:hypothetical protein
MVDKIFEQLKVYYKLLYKPKPPLEPLRTEYLKQLIKHFNDLKLLISNNYDNLNKDQQDKLNEVHEKARKKVGNVLERLKIKIEVPVAISELLNFEPDLHPLRKSFSLSDVGREFVPEHYHETGIMVLTAIDFQSYAVKVIPEFDGSPGELQRFLDALVLVDLNKADFEAQAVAIIKIKLKGTARSFITQENTIAQIRDKLKATVKSESSKSIISKMQSVKPQNKSTCQYVKDVEELCASLKRTYMEEGLNPEMAEKYTANEAVKSMTEASSDPSMKIIMTAGEFSTVTDVVAKYVHAMNSKQNIAQANVNFIGSRGRGRGRGRGYRNGYNNNWNNGWNNNTWTNGWNNNNWNNGWRTQRSRGRGRGRGNGGQNTGGQRSNNINYVCQGNDQETQNVSLGQIQQNQ